MEHPGDRPGLLLVTELIDVRAGGEDPLAAGDHDGARQVGCQLVDRPVQLAEQGGERALTLPLRRVMTATPSSRRSSVSSSYIGSSLAAWAR